MNSFQRICRSPAFLVLALILCAAVIAGGVALAPAAPKVWIVIPVLLMPNDTVAPIHGRMPLLLSHEQVRPWLVDAGAALELLCSRPPLLLRTSCDGQLGFDDLA